MGILLYLASLKLSRVAGGGGGWKNRFNENPVVSLDLDLDFGLLLRVFQKGEKLIVCIIKQKKKKKRKNKRKDKKH